MSAAPAGGARPLLQPAGGPAAQGPGPGAQPPEAHPPRQQNLRHVRSLIVRWGLFSSVMVFNKVESNVVPRFFVSFLDIFENQSILRICHADSCY